MRPKTVILVVTLGLLVFGALFAIRQTAVRSASISETAPSLTQSTDAMAPAISQLEPTVPLAKNSTLAEVQPTTSSEDAHKSYVDQRSAELMDMAMTDDRASLDTILSELTNRDPEIRKAALEAAIQFGSRDAIPKLADAVSQTDDPNEKAAISDAIEFLKLPSLTEIRSQAAKTVAKSGTAGTKPARKGALGKRVQSTPPSNQ
jgi:hypothetical protein